MFQTFNPKAIAFFAAMLTLLGVFTVVAILNPPAPEDRVPLVVVLIVYIFITLVMFVSYVSDKVGEREREQGYASGWENGVHSGWDAAESGVWQSPHDFIDNGD